MIVLEKRRSNHSKENDYGGFSAILQIAELTKNDFLESLYTPRKHQKTSIFLIFSGGIERDRWHEMGQ